jgi:hypothetical protein
VRGDQLVQQAVELLSDGIAAESLQLGPGDYPGVGLGEDVDDDCLGGKRQLVVV